MIITFLMIGASLLAAAAVYCYQSHHNQILKENLTKLALRLDDLQTENATLTHSNNAFSSEIDALKVSNEQLGALKEVYNNTVERLERDNWLLLQEHKKLLSKQQNSTS